MVDCARLYNNGRLLVVGSHNGVTAESCTEMAVFVWYSVGGHIGCTMDVTMGVVRYMAVFGCANGEAIGSVQRYYAEDSLLDLKPEACP